MMKKSYAKNLIAAVITSSFYLPVMFANADEYNHMNHDIHNEDQMHDHGDNPIVTKVMFDQLEWRDANDTGVIEAQAWIGKDLNKLWLKAHIEKSDAEKHAGETEDAEVQALYSRAIATYWDMQIGVREDIKPTPTRTWAVIGVQGLAPYFFNVDAALFVGEAGRTAARISAEYDLLLTQRLILSPEVEINIYGQNDAETGTGSGLSNAQAGLRLRYEIRREFAPYIGVDWNKKFGNTAVGAESRGDPSSDTSVLAGIRIWF
jgi:copper resistance protein B